MPTIHQALRQLIKAPGFTATVVIVLALGVGATTAIFSVVHAVLLHPFPYVDGNAILFLGSNQRGQDGSMPVTYPDFLDWRARAQATSHLAYAHGNSATLAGSAEPTAVRQGAVSADVWPLLGIPPVLGRTFTAAEDQPGADPVVVLSHATWTNQFQADPEILQRSITLDERTYAVIGVMPPSFKFWAADVWTPVGLQADTDLMRSRVMRADSWVVARAAPGKSDEDVSVELNLIADQIAQQYPDSNKDVGVSVRRLSDSVTGPFRRPLMVLLGAVAGVLLIACANIANLMLARMSTRQHEFAVRAAIGASRGHLVRQTLLESLPLALLGGTAGLLVGTWSLDALLIILPRDAVPAEAQIHVNGPVMLFALAVTLGTTLLFALFPALEGSRAALQPALQESSRGTASRRTGRVRALLVIAEVALSLTLLIGAGLLLRSFGQLTAVDPGFVRERLVMVPVQLPASRYPSTQSAMAFFQEAVDRLRALPGVASASASNNAPFAGGIGMPLLTEERTYTDLSQVEGVQLSLVLDDYFTAQGLRLARGRSFTSADRAGAQPVIILNEAAVKKFLPEGDPLGKRVMLGLPEHLITPGLLPPGLDKFQWATVVGVVPSTRHFGLQAEPPPAVYIPADQAWDYPDLRRFMYLLVRTVGAPEQIVPDVRSLLASLDPALPLGRIVTADAMIGDTLRGERFNVVLLGLFAGVALALAAVGIYGVVAWNVTQRTREIGIRLALGAERTSVLRMIVVQSMHVVGVGLGFGLFFSLLAARAMNTMVYGISAFDPLTFIGVALVLAASALLASWLPARPATKVDPLTALRSE